MPKQVSVTYQLTVITDEDVTLVVTHSKQRIMNRIRREYKLDEQSTSILLGAGKLSTESHTFHYSEVPLVLVRFFDPTRN